MKILSSPTLAQLSEFDEIIDVRSPSEFSLDHIPGARNCPVLDDEERAKVGTLYKQDPFLAKKMGAAMVSRNIARHLETSLLDKPRTWRPLIYCWRGGKRSGAMAHILSEIGWHTMRLEGGYKAYRKMVLEALDRLPERFEFRVICGATGCGKSRLIKALSGIGEQVLDLEEIARHRGSVLGKMPGIEQPGQKYFESCIWHILSGFDPGKPVYIESESKKIGNLRVPQAVMDAMWKSRCIRIEASVSVRSRILNEEYRHFFGQPEILFAQLDRLMELHGHETIGSWKSMAERGEWDLLIKTLLENHYDRAYEKSITKHYATYSEMPAHEVFDPTEPGFKALAEKILASSLAD